MYHIYVFKNPLSIEYQNMYLYIHLHLQLCRKGYKRLHDSLLTMVMSGEEVEGMEEFHSLLSFLYCFSFLYYMVLLNYRGDFFFFFFYRYKNVKSSFKCLPDLLSLSGSLSAFSLCGH